MAQEIKGKAEAIYALLQDELGKPKRQRVNKVEDEAEKAWEEAEKAFQAVKEAEEAEQAGEVVSVNTSRINARAAARRAIAAEAWAEQLKVDADEALQDSERAWKVFLDATESSECARTAVKAARAELGL